jgi:hypothetical protein
METNRGRMSLCMLLLITTFYCTFMYGQLLLDMIGLFAITHHYVINSYLLWKRN